MSRTIEQDRARSAWANVEAAQQGASEKEFKAYGQLLQGLPVAIHTAGLGQTVAFYRAKGKPEHRLALAHLAGWLLHNAQDRSGDALMRAIQDGTASGYRRLTAEALAYLAWLKRFAAAKAPVESQSDA